MQDCPHCGKPNRDTARFCQGCGNALNLVCPKCGTVNPPKAKFCLNCAASLSITTPGESLPHQGAIPIPSEEISLTPGAASPKAGDPSLVSGAIPMAPAPSAASQAASLPVPPSLEKGKTGMIKANSVIGGRYTVLGKLGRGGMGAVYLASDVRLKGKFWAIKELSTAALPGPEEKQQAILVFQQEATLLASLDHSNLTKVVDYFEDRGKHFLVMDYIDGQTLAEMLEGRKEPFSEELVLEWARQLGDVLSYLHNRPQPIIFRDLKPANIMVDKGGRVRLIDFGIARLFKPGKSHDTMSFGTDGYAPPEQYGRGQTDPRSDVYALGATLHQLVTLRDPGVEPFKFPPACLLNPKISQNVSDALARAVQREVKDRWQNVSEMIHALVRTEEAVAAPTSLGTTIPKTILAPPLPGLTSSPGLTPVSIPQSVPRYSQPPAAASAPGAQAPVRPATRGSRLGGVLLYVLVVGILAALNYGLTLPPVNEYSRQWGAYAWVVPLMLAGIVALLGPILTRRPGAAFLILAAPALVQSVLGGYLTDPWVLRQVLGALALELVFTVTRYKKFSFGLLWAALIISNLTFIGYDFLNFGNTPSLFDNVIVGIGYAFSALVAFWIGKALHR
jgi:serine/threonine-protein kinase